MSSAVHVCTSRGTQNNFNEYYSYVFKAPEQALEQSHLQASEQVLDRAYQLMQHEMGIHVIMNGRDETILRK